MSGFDHAGTPAAPHELVRALADVLRADAELAAPERLGGPHVYAQRQPDAKGRPDRFIVVRAVITPGGLAEGYGRPVAVPLQVMVETKPGTSPDAEGLHAAIHARAHALLAGRGAPDRPLPLAHGRVASPVQRRRVHAAVAYDAADGADYSTDAYTAALIPLAA